MGSVSNTGEDALHYKLVPDGAEHSAPYTHENLRTVYCVDSCIDWILANNLNRVGVQFPLELAHDAPHVARLIIHGTGCTDTFIMFHSPTARCCVNHKSAAYGAADGIIQFGRSCLTSFPTKPVLRVLAPHWQLDSDAVVAGICSVPEVQEILQLQRQLYTSDDPVTDSAAGGTHPLEVACGWPQKEVVVLYDTRCAYAMREVEEKLRKQLPHFQMSRLLFRDGATKAAPASEGGERMPCHCSADYSVGVCGPCLSDEKRWRFTAMRESLLTEDISDVISADDSGLVDPPSTGDDTCSGDTGLIPGAHTSSCDGAINMFLLNHRLVRSHPNSNPSDFLFVYVGRAGPTLTCMSLQVSQCSLYVIDPTNGEVSSSNAAKIVMQRNYKIEQIRDAQKVGVLLSNGNLPRFRELYERLSALIVKAGKTRRMYYMPAPNLPKILNFPDNDVMIYLSCPESTIIERQVDPDVYRLMATPWELELALNPNQKWSLNFQTNSQELLEGGCSHAALPEGAVQEETVSVSLLSNRVQGLGLRSSVDTVAAPLTSATGAVLQRSSLQLQQVVQGHAKGLLWGETAWRGLDPDQEEGAPLGTVVEGRKGVAGGYCDEGEGRRD